VKISVHYSVYIIKTDARLAQRCVSISRGHGTEYFFVRLLTGRCLLFVSDRQTAAPLMSHPSESAATRAVSCCCILNAYPIAQPNSQPSVLHCRASCCAIYCCASTETSSVSGRKYFKKVLSELPTN